jgi:multidrug efflux pump subunit AcrB
VISLENIYRHLEVGSSPAVAAEQGGAEVYLAVFAATMVNVVDFFPVSFLYGVSKFLFSALALAFCLSLMASFVVAMTVIPLFCSKYLKGVHHEIPRQDSEEGSVGDEQGTWGGRFNHWFNRVFNQLLDIYERWLRVALKRPALTVIALMTLFVASFAIYPFLGLAFFPRTTPASSPSTSKRRPEPASKLPISMWTRSSV